MRAFVFLKEPEGWAWTKFLEACQYKGQAWTIVGPKPWKFQFFFNEIKELSSHLDVAFPHEFRSANSILYMLARKGIISRSSVWVGSFL